MKNKPNIFINLDKFLLYPTIFLSIFGLILIASSSIPIASKFYHQEFYFFFKQLNHLIIAILISAILLQFDTQTIIKNSNKFLYICLIFLLFIILFGKTVNGSKRWLVIAHINFQCAEFVKLAVILYITKLFIYEKFTLEQDYLINFIPLGIITILLLLQPDFGSIVVIVAVTLIGLWLTEVKKYYFLWLFISISIILFLLAIIAPYRMNRLTSFINPWSDQFGHGYQLSQALIAFGRGSWFGEGLGASIQKLFYLPEAHTDFIFSILAEEFGIVGALSIIILYFFIFSRGIYLAIRSYENKLYPASFLAAILSGFIILQTYISISANIGLLPTKGLALPFLSYGGNNLLVNIFVITLLLRISYELKVETKLL